MNKVKKIEYLKNNHFGKFIATRMDVFNNESSRQQMFCVCGKLATGLHERSCRKFNNLVDSKTADILSDLTSNK